MFGMRVPQLMQVVRCTCLRLAPSPSLSLPRKFHEATAEPDTRYHQIDGQTSEQQREIAYKKSDGPQKLGLIYIPGFMAHKGGGKPLALHTFAQKNGFPYVRYDPSGMGESKGVHVTETRFSMWLEDASEILQNVTEGPQIIVSSSMGSWITCLLASKFPEKLLGVVMLAPAINFHTRYEKVLRSQLPPEALKLYEEGGVVKLYAPDYGEFPLSKAQFAEMKKYTLPLQEDQVAVTCPTRVIHGMKDKDVPHTESLALVNSLKSQDVELNYLKHSGHTLLDDASLQVIYDTILRLNHHLLHSQAEQ